MNAGVGGIEHENRHRRQEAHGEANNPHVGSMGLVTGASQGLHRNTDSATYGAWYTFGNAENSMGFAGTGTPAEAYAPFVVYQKFGDYVGLTNANVLKTTQGSSFLTAYYGPTTDDSAQATVFFIAMKDTGTPYVQTKPVTAVEAHVSIDGDNDLTGGTARAVVQAARFTNGTGLVDTVDMFRSSSLVNAGTITTWCAFRQSATPGGTVTTKYGAYLMDRVLSETGVEVTKSGTGQYVQMLLAGSGGSSPSLALFNMPNVTGGDTDMSGIRVQQGPGGLKNLQEWWLTGGTFPVARVTRLGGFTLSNTIRINNTSDTVTMMQLDPGAGITFGAAMNLIFDTATGTKIGTATTQKIGFYNATPVVKPTGVAVTAAGVHAALVTLGLIAA